jgi:hypothetical protein
MATIDAVMDILSIGKSPFRDSTAVRIAGSAPKGVPSKYDVPGGR